MKGACANGRLVVLFAGVGGQGGLSAARFLGEAGHRLGLALTVSQLHGMSQRGGAVQASVCFGSDQVVALGRAGVDVLVVLELLEALRVADRVDGHTTVLCNRWLSPPPAAALSRQKVPTEDEVLDALRKRAGTVRVVDAVKLAERAGSRGAANAVMLGALTALPGFPVPAEALARVVSAASTGRMVGVNERALAFGAAALGEGAIASEKAGAAV